MKFEMKNVKAKFIDEGCETIEMKLDVEADDHDTDKLDFNIKINLEGYFDLSDDEDEKSVKKNKKTKIKK